MKFEDAIKRADAIFTMNNISDEQKISWLAEFDKRLLREVYATHEVLCDLATRDWIEYVRNLFLPLYQSAGAEIPSVEEVEELTSTELLLPEEHQEIYVYYLLYKYYFFAGEYGRANNYAAEYTGLYNNYVNWVNRTYRPIVQR